MYVFFLARLGREAPNVPDVGTVSLLHCWPGLGSGISLRGPGIGLLWEKAWGIHSLQDPILVLTTTKSKCHGWKKNSCAATQLRTQQALKSFIWNPTHLDRIWQNGTYVVQTRTRTSDIMMYVHVYVTGSHGHGSQIHERVCSTMSTSRAW